jgi:hypothetical protein
LAAHRTVIAWLRAADRAGINSAISSAMIPMTTNSSTREKPRAVSRRIEYSCSRARKVADSFGERPKINEADQPEPNRLFSHAGRRGASTFTRAAQIRRANSFVS